IDLSNVDALIVRTMPPGSLEQVVFRMNLLAQIEARGLQVLNPPRAIECAVDKYLTTARLTAAGLPVPDVRLRDHRGGPGRFRAPRRGRRRKAHLRVRRARDPARQRSRPCASRIPHAGTVAGGALSARIRTTRRLRSAGDGPRWKGAGRDA